jgi:hypothetical protein
MKDRDINMWDRNKIISGQIFDNSKKKIIQSHHIINSLHTYSQ